jgi:hypothetical protein
MSDPCSVNNFGNRLYPKNKRKAWSLLFRIYSLAYVTHWDFLPKFLSLHYYTTLEGVFVVQRSGQAHGTIICLFGPLFFSQNGMTLKNLQKSSKSSEELLFFGILSEFVQFWLENSGSNQLDELKWIILLLLKPKPSLEAE